MTDSECGFPKPRFLVKLLLISSEIVVELGYELLVGTHWQT